MQKVENLILRNLLRNEEYSRKVLPFLSKEYFLDHTEKELYIQIDNFINKYNNLPTKEALVIELDNSTLKEEEFESIAGLIDIIAIKDSTTLFLDVKTPSIYKNNIRIPRLTDAQKKLGEFYE